MRRCALVRSALLAAVVVLVPCGLGGQAMVRLPQQDLEVRLDTGQEYSVGSLVGAEWETFARVTSVAFDGSGNLYILDADNGRVVKVGPGGILLAELGRKGEGPGEFQMPMGMAVTRDGEVAVFDIGHRGFTLFASDGSFLRTVPLATGTAGALSFPVGNLLPHPRGGVLSGGGGLARVTMGPQGPGSVPQGRPITHYSLEDGTSRTVFEAWGPAPPPAGGGRPTNLSSGGGRTVTFTAGVGMPRAFEPGLHVGALPDGALAVADTSTWRVKVVGMDGATLRVLERPIRPREVNRRDQEDEKARRLAAMESSGGPRLVMRTDQGTTTMRGDEIQRMMEEQIKAMEFAEVIPVVSRLGVDWSGRVWLERTGERVGEAGPVDLFSADGRYLGSLAAGTTAMPDAFGPEGLAAFIERDELDVPRVVVRRLTIR